MARYTLICPAGDVQADAVLAAAKFADVEISVDSSDASVGACRSTPVLVTPHGRIAERDAILRYIAGLVDDSGLYGSTLFEAALVDQWLEFCSLEIEQFVVLLDPAQDAQRQLNRDTGGGGGKRKQYSEKELEKPRAIAREHLPHKLLALERHLLASTFLAGDRITVADIGVAASLRGLFARVISPADRDARFQNTTRWFMTVAHQPQFVTVLGKTTLHSGGAAPAAAAASAASAASGGGAAASAGAGSAGPSAVVNTSVARSPSALFGRGRSRVAEIVEAEDGGASQVGSTVTVAGWSRTMRKQEKDTLIFLEVNDGSCFGTLQVVAKRDTTTGFEDLIRDGGVGASVRCVGELVASPAKGQVVELVASEARVIGSADNTAYPLAKKRHTLEHLRGFLHLRPRTNIIGAATRIRNACAFATHTFFQERGFLYIHTPLITTSDCEGAGEMFQVTTLLPEDATRDLPRVKETGAIDYSRDFFAKPANLTVSGQLQVESFCVGMGDVYTFGPTFRAEKSKTSRHLAEFWMIEPEIAFADLNDNMDITEDYVKFCTQFVLDRCMGDLRFLDARVEKGLIARLQNVVESPFERITYTRACDILLDAIAKKKVKFESEKKRDTKLHWGTDFGSEHERYLTEQVFKKPVIVTDYPADIKAFYMKANPTDAEGRRTVRAMDVLVPKIGELCGGSQREEVLSVLEARVDAMGLPKEELQWYLDLRRYGSVPHSGFGCGFERLVMYVSGIENIRDVIPFPRYLGHASD